ncbi:MAG: glycosyl transferase family 1, partial [Planctomycetota bacterium]
MPETPPEPDLRHLFALTDDTGIFQHAVYATPNRHTGYTTDDNARGALVAARLWARERDPRLLRCLQTYLSALHGARPEPGCRFLNFQAYDRRWLDEAGSDDCQGRVLWALGHVVAHPPTDAIGRFAAELWRSALPLLDTLEHPRGLALGVLGLRFHAGDAPVREAMSRLAAALERRFAAYEWSTEWPWFQDKVSYDNGRLPQALLVAGRLLGEDALVQRGARV